MRGVLVASLGEQYAEDMAVIGCPVQLVWGEKDTEVPLEVAVRAQGVVSPGLPHRASRRRTSGAHRGARPPSCCDPR